MLTILDFVEIICDIFLALYVISHFNFSLLFLVHKLLVFGDFEVDR
jgi:hypothetical protein